MLTRLKDLTGFSKPANPRPDDCSSLREATRKIPGWAWELALLALLILILRHWLGRQDRKVSLPAEIIELPASRVSDRQEASESVAATPVPEPQPMAPAEDMTPAEPDDLRQIEGIGPKVAELMQTSGITTYAQLAQSEVGRLKQVLKEAGLTMINPTTWPQQARLAADGDWETLRELQGSLKRARRG